MSSALDRSLLEKCSPHPSELNKPKRFLSSRTIDQTEFIFYLAMILSNLPSLLSVNKEVVKIRVYYREFLILSPSSED